MCASFHPCCLTLQMKEVALIHSEGILAGEMKHGPLALVDEHMPIVVVATRDGMYSKMESVIHQLLARNARLIILCNQGDKAMRKCATQHKCQLIEVCGAPMQMWARSDTVMLLAWCCAAVCCACC